MEPTPDPAVSDTTMGWEQLEQLISDHLFGAVRDNQTVWCDAPGTRYVQYSCIGEDGFDAEAVGPEFIEAGSDFYTSERTETLAMLGFSEPQPNFHARLRSVRAAGSRISRCDHSAGCVGRRPRGRPRARRLNLKAGSRSSRRAPPKSFVTRCSVIGRQQPRLLASARLRGRRPSDARRRQPQGEQSGHHGDPDEDGSDEVERVEDSAQ